MDSSFGVHSVSWELTTSVDVDHSTEVKVLLDKNGHHYDTYMSDDSYKVTVKGHGDDSPVGITDFGQASSPGKPTYGNVTGGFIVNSVKSTQTNEDWITWEYSGTVYPHLLE
jgi:hypothetical protein